MTRATMNAGFALNGFDLETGVRYAHLDDAMKAASCLCGLHPAGVTIYGSTDTAEAHPDSGEAYRLATLATRTDGSGWPVPSAPYEPVYTVTSHRR